MNELMIFESEQFGKVRTTMIDNEPWFVAADVCEYFGVTNRNRVMQALDDDEKGGTQMMTPGGMQTVTIVNEAGLYSLLFALQPTKARGVSDDYIEKRCAELKAFKRWITHEVLPSIRKHGGYLTPEKVEEALLNPDTLIRLATTLKEEREARRIAESKNAQLVEKVEADAPKVLFADSVAASKQSILVGEMAKLLRQNGLEIGQNRLFNRLRREGFLGNTGERYNMPTQRAMDMGLFEIKEVTVTNADGSIRLTRTPKVTGKGQLYFVNRFLNQA